MRRERLLVAAGVALLVLLLLGVALRVIPADRRPLTAESPRPTAPSAPGRTQPPTSPAPGATPTPAPGTSPTSAPSPSAEPAPSTTSSPGPTGSPGPGPIDAREAPCPDDVARGWECITLTVPLDHFDAGNSATTEVTFALRRHSGAGPGKGVFVTATGGPGTSGISSAAGYTSAFAREIRLQYDIVFFDQRGIGLSGPVLQCPDAMLGWYTDPSRPEDSSATTGLGAAARAAAEGCVAEMEAAGVDPATLPFYGTEQAVEDLEAFRAWFGAESIHLYGESYGSQLVQTYAAAHPSRVEVLYVDGPVDLELRGVDYWAEGTRAFDQVLEATLLDCSTQEACTADIERGGALTTYDEIAAFLEQSPIGYTFTLEDGTQEERTFTATDLENAAAGYAYDEFDRMLFQRALAAASRGDVWWLARLASIALGQDPDTLEAIPDETYSDALYYAVECLDYGYFEGTPEERAQAYLDHGRELGFDSARIAANFYGDLPCVFWPGAAPTDERPPGLTGTPYPMVILGATLDPATPWANAERIFKRNPGQSWLIVKPGGPHIIFGRGEACPDDLVTAILTRGEFPAERRTVCPGDVADDYVGLPERSVDGYETSLEALSDLDDEINHSADYWAWDGEEPLAYGCPFGGTITYTTSRVGYRLALDECAFSEQLPLTGEGSIDEVAGTFSLDVQAPAGSFAYRRDADGERTLTGPETLDLAAWIVHGWGEGSVRRTESGHPPGIPR